MPWRALNDGSAGERPGAAECWRLLGAHSVGRLCFCVGERVHVVLTAYVVLDEHLYFRAAAFGPLARRVLTRPVTLQVDDLQSDRRATWTVTATGAAQHVDDASTLAALWTPVRPTPQDVGHEPRWISLTPDEIQCRRIHS
jgi:nitroimidazol reductase NimA-like FMN-containing flavoprotein (pyridoxamine 5'-phosphate oxidase superfamily)